jgi:hypothetical protein
MQFNYVVFALLRWMGFLSPFETFLLAHEQSIICFLVFCFPARSVKSDWAGSMAFIGFAGSESVSSRDFLFISTCFIVSSPLSVGFFTVIANLIFFVDNLVYSEKLMDVTTLKSRFDTEQDALVGGS